MIETIQLGIPVARVELLDDIQMGAVIAFNKMEGYRPADTLFFEFHGTTRWAAEQATEVVGEIARGQRRRRSAGRPWPRREVLARAARGLLCGTGAAAGLQGLADRRPAMPISRLAEVIGDQGRYRGLRRAGADRRPCRRRQLPPGVPDRSG
ncbi:MAG: hypothetical protein R3F55_15705 [Alphaproteobacteria bacterium]